MKIEYSTTGFQAVLTAEKDNEGSTVLPFNSFVRGNKLDYPIVQVFRITFAGAMLSNHIQIVVTGSELFLGFKDISVIKGDKFRVVLR